MKKNRGGVARKAGGLGKQSTCFPVSFLHFQVQDNF